MTSLKFNATNCLETECEKLIIISAVVSLSFGAVLQNAGVSTLSNHQVAVFNDWNYTRHNLFPYSWAEKNPHGTLQQLFNATKPDTIDSTFNSLNNTKKLRECLPCIPVAFV